MVPARPAATPRPYWRAPFDAIYRARIATLTIAATYALSVLVGIAMVDLGSGIAVGRRDAIVGSAQSSDILIAHREGDHVRAALLDFSSNLTMAVMPSTAIGVGVVLAYPVVAYRGWIGGIVSIDSQHRSRLADPGAALYYLVTLILQLVPSSIAGGMGVYLGIGAWRALRVPTATWLGLPTDRLRDVAQAYVVITPLLLIASLWEFLA